MEIAVLVIGFVVLLEVVKVGLLMHLLGRSRRQQELLDIIVERQSAPVARDGYDAGRGEAVRGGLDDYSTVSARTAVEEPVATPVVPPISADMEPEPVLVPEESETVPPEPVFAAHTEDWAANESATKTQAILSRSEIWEKRLRLEQWIGTRGLLVLGILATLLGTGFFLRYAYDNDLIGPWGRVGITAFAGLLALGFGEWTRRRDYDIVARGLTALGFALLYAGVFSAYAFYHLLPALPAFGLSILVTAAAMLYAVFVDEILAAFIALLGGFLAPYLLSTGENRPTLLFSYVTLLTSGALACALVRKWRPVNVLAFLGTYGLYIGWFERFYRALSEGWPPQAGAAIAWLSVFFVIFLILPLLYELRLRVAAGRLDVVLVLANALIAFAYFTRMLHPGHDKILAGVAIALAGAHLVLRHIMARRHPGDTPLSVVLLAIGLFFVTVAPPLYFGNYATVMAWAAQGVVLTLIGLHYRSLLSRASGFIAFILSVAWVARTPHAGAFALFLNQTFLTWCWLIAAVYIAHWLYRRSTKIEPREGDLLTNVLFGLAWALLAAALVQEWRGHVAYNEFGGLLGHACTFEKGLTLIAAALVLLAVVRPVPPGKAFWPGLAWIAALGTSGWFVWQFPAFYRAGFTIFLNPGFLVAGLLVGSLFGSAIMVRRLWTGIPNHKTFWLGFALTGTALLWLVLTEQIYTYWNQVGRIENPERARFLGHMYVSILWTVYAAVLMVLGFWKHSVLLRYLALGLIGLVIVKVFLFDTSSLKSIYRVGGLVVLGLVLVGLSYLYQYGRKQGFFGEAKAGPESE